MRALDVIDQSWYPIRHIFSMEPLATLKEEILPNISYQPRNKEHIFRVFEKPLRNIRVVILGQDPYPTPGDCIGYAFAVEKDRKIPKSLQVIQKEITNTVGISEFENWRTLQHWVDQGVFLLNTALTVETGRSGSHLKYWQDAIRKVVSFISDTKPVIWLLLGKKAQSFIPYLKGESYYVSKKYTKDNIHLMPASPFYNYIVTAPHPAAELYSSDAGFLGSKCFAIVNQILINNNQEKIIW